MTESVTAFGPASIGNLGVGFDMLGLALEGVGDRVVARRVTSPGITIAEVRGMDGEIHPYLSNDAEHNTASIAAQALWDQVGAEGGAELKVLKGVPLQSGMGSSAASAVAAVVAVNALLDEPLAVKELLPSALEGEKYASGGLHADNVAPSLLGGLILCPQVLLPNTVRLPVPTGVQAGAPAPGVAGKYRSSSARPGQALFDGAMAEPAGLPGGFRRCVCGQRPRACATDTERRRDRTTTCSRGLLFRHGQERCVERRGAWVQSVG